MLVSDDGYLFPLRMKRIAYFGGTFDPVHNGHLDIARSLSSLFELDRFYFLPAFHAPHKPDRPPTSGYHRFAMLSLVTESDELLAVSTLELDRGEKRYTIDTLADLKILHPADRVFFAMGADSWADIRTWHDWENVLLSSDHIVVTRPGYEIGTDHVTDAARERIVDLRGSSGKTAAVGPDRGIFITDAVRQDISATEIREDVAADDVLDGTNAVPAKVAKYIEKYDLYR